MDPLLESFALIIRSLIHEISLGFCSPLSPQSVFCPVQRLIYAAIVPGYCITAQNTFEVVCSCHLVSPAKYSHGTAMFQTLPSGTRCVCPLWNFCLRGRRLRPLPLLLTSQTSSSLLWTMGQAFKGRRGKHSLPLSSFWGNPFCFPR